VATTLVGLATRIAAKICDVPSSGGHSSVTDNCARSRLPGAARRWAGDRRQCDRGLRRVQAGEHQAREGAPGDRRRHRAVEGRTHVLLLELDVLREVAEWMDRQRSVWGRFMDVVDEYLKEEGTK
jgi:hypothetical protein